MDGGSESSGGGRSFPSPYGCTLPLCDGKWSVNFATNPQGDVDKATMSLDENEAVFTRRAAAIDAALSNRLAGTYVKPNGNKFQVVVNPAIGLFIIFPVTHEQILVPYKGLKFRVPEFSDVMFEFVEENGQITSLKQSDPSGVYTFKRQ